MGDDHIDLETSRRRFLTAVAGVSAVIPLAAPMAAASVTAAAAEAPPAAKQPAAAAAAAPAPAAEGTAGYIYFGIEEAALVEAMTDAMCPPDGLTPSGTDSGLATYIDRQLAGAFGSGDRLYRDGPWVAGKPQQGYQHPGDPKSFFSAGLIAMQHACQAATGTNFAELSPADRDAFLASVAASKVTDDRFSLAEWFNELVYPLFEQACFADPIYGGNRGKVFWRMIGYPGLPAFHTLDVEQYRGKPYPGASQPQSISDFS